MTPKQTRFIDEYLIDLNATQAAVRAGYSVRTAEWIGPQLLGKSHVSEAVAVQMKAREVRTFVTQDKTLREIARIAFADPRKLMHSDGRIKLPHELDDDTAAAVASFEVSFEGSIRYRFWDKNAALEKACKHQGLFEHDNRQKTDPLRDLLVALSGNVIGASSTTE